MAPRRIDTGAVSEQSVSIDDNAGQPLVLRRIELQLDSPTADGDTVIRLLTNVPRSHCTARKVARLSGRRWNIESMFQRLESVLASEVAPLGQPHAALLAFGVAVLAYNVLAVLQAAVRAAHALPAGDIELSSYYFAVDIKAHYACMMVAVALAVWRIRRVDGAATGASVDADGGACRSGGVAQASTRAQDAQQERPCARGCGAASCLYRPGAQGRRVN